MVEPNIMYQRILWNIFAPLRVVIRMGRRSINNPGRVFFGLLGLYFAIAFSVYLVIRIKFPFWSRQPVFHAGLFMLKPWQFWYPVGIIRNLSRAELCTETSKKPFFQWYIRDIIRYQWKHPSRYSKTELKECLDFLTENFYSQKKNGVKYCPSDNDWLNPFETPEGRLSVYRGEKLINTNMRPIHGIMGSFPLRIRLFDKKWRDIKMNYVDYLCIARGQRRRGLAEKIIYSHCSRLSFDSLQNKSNTLNNCILFKREDGSSGDWWQMGIVPLWRYNAVGVYLSDENSNSENTSEYSYLSLEKAWTTWNIDKLPTSFRLSNVESIQNVQEVMLMLQTERSRDDEGETYQHLDRKRNQKTLLVTPEWTGLAKMIERKHLIIHLLRDDVTFEILGIYFWKKNDTFYFHEDDNTPSSSRSPSPSIEFQCAVWFGKDRHHPLFFSGFRASIEQVFQEMCGDKNNKSEENKTSDKQKNVPKSRSLMVWFEPIGDAEVIVERIREKSNYFMTTPMAYFTYNFSIPSIDANKIVAIGL